MSRLPSGICQLKKSPDNDITVPLAFTVCKLELGEKAIVLQSCLDTHILGWWPTIMGKTEGKRYATKQKETDMQLPKHDYKQAFLTDMKSKIESS